MKSTRILSLIPTFCTYSIIPQFTPPCSAYQQLKPIRLGGYSKEHVNTCVTKTAENSRSLQDRVPRSNPRQLLKEPGTALRSSNFFSSMDWASSPIRTGRDRCMGTRFATMSTASTVGGLMTHTSSSAGSTSVNWPLWYVLPIAPYQKRKTIMKEIVPGKVSRTAIATRYSMCYMLR